MPDLHQNLFLFSVLFRHSYLSFVPSSPEWSLRCTCWDETRLCNRSVETTMFSQLRIVQKLSAPVWAPQFYLYQNVYSFQSLHKFYILTVKETFLPTWLCSKDNQADRAVSRAGAETVRQAGVSTFLAGRHSVHLYCVKLARETSRVSLVLEQESSWVAAEPSSSSVQRWPPAQQRWEPTRSPGLISVSSVLNTTSLYRPWSGQDKVKFSSII